MSKRKQFLDSVHHEHVQDFLNFIRLHKDGADPFDLTEVLAELQRSQRQELWERQLKLLQHSLTAYPPERWITGAEEDAGDMEVEISEEQIQTMAVIEGVTIVSTVSVDILQENDTYTSLLNCAHMLNCIESALPLSHTPLQQAIHWLFECWWKRDLNGKEELGWTAFLVCLENTVTLEKPVSELRRLCTLREVLLSVDFASERGQQVIDPLLQCFFKASHIKQEEGKRFLAFLFSWNDNFIRMIHETIKNQLPFFPKTLSVHVAEIYFRAWRKASGPSLEEIESTCIQDLMQNAVLLHRNSPVHSKVRQILTYFHKQKFREGIDEMLHRLYKPILWKALKATNAEVRANATLLFTEAFPIHDPSMSSEMVDQAVQKQLDLLFALLDDPQPLVRSSAVLGVCSVLGRCWEVIPSTVITDLLEKLILQLANDTSSPDVRCSVFMCMSIILDNSLSHPLMEKLLPALKSSLHDSSEKVRVAFVGMLLKIKGVRAAKFWKVCSLEHLLARLEMDSPPVSKRIVNLLFNSFFPVNQPETVWCERCVTLIQTNPGAARKFYQHAYLYTAPANIVKLMLVIRKCLNVCIQNAGDDEFASSNKENSTMLEDVLSVQDTASMASLLEILVILWKSVQKSLMANQEAFKYTTSKFASVLPQYLKIFQEERCKAPLILLASLLPATAVPALRSKVMSNLRSLKAGTAVAAYSQSVECVCSWGQISHIVELIENWLTEAAPVKVQGDEDTTGKVHFDGLDESKPDLGLDYLDYLLLRPKTRDCLLTLPLDQIRPLHKALNKWKLLLFSSLSGSEVSGAVIETALRAFVVHGRLSIHLQHKYPEEREFLKSLEQSVSWVEKKVLPFLANSSSEQQLYLSRKTVESSLTVCKNVLQVSVGDNDFRDHLLQHVASVLQTEKGYICTPHVLALLTEVAQGCLSHKAEGQEDQLSLTIRILTNIFQKIVEIIAHRLRKDKEEGQELCVSSEEALHDFLLVTKFTTERSEFITGVFSSLCAAVIIDISRTLQKISHVEEVLTPETVNDLPPLSNTILKVTLRSPAVIRFFLSEMSSSIESEAIDSITQWAAVTHILTIIKQSDAFVVELKEIAVSVRRQIQNHYNISAENSDNIQRTVYESTIMMLNDILNPCQTPNR
ncbi:condensin-2 complex subunit G2 isoform X1 [Megalobrama amblycephala]|uniref:condensin-2 complex subunit G2 isoform X1 n=1 Tax=Megalobrama amblycephala TaxID=75352 RepID=UPI002013EB4E|nr:condensin-2 complex subunit G2 isoform X1 [Megalobrama amblycephala]XP_048040751.1 condensin-2 complex subunit G2 isoform X1 [Megalobrama amblycephala]XP_048040753.1 condensin-2 complex subunit G2 isoform X1 [Megalobrama amblycephala]